MYDQWLKFVNIRYVELLFQLEFTWNIVPSSLTSTYIDIWKPMVNLYLINLMSPVNTTCSSKGKKSYCAFIYAWSLEIECNHKV